MDVDLDSEVNGWVNWAYALANLDVANPPRSMLALARALFGARGVVKEQRRPMVRDAMILPEGDRSSAPASPYVMYLRPGLGVARAKWAIAHEIAEWTLRHQRMEPLIEVIADQLAAALIAPRQAYLAFHRAHGFDLALFARAFGVSQSCMALRFGETTYVPSLLVTSTSIRQRGDAFVFPSSLRRLATRPDPPPALPFGVRVIPLSDDRNRVLLVADGVSA